MCELPHWAEILLFITIITIAILLQVLGRECEANTNQVSDLTATVPALSLSSDGLVGLEAGQGLLWSSHCGFHTVFPHSAPV